jgi:hypothetical protein
LSGAEPRQGNPAEDARTRAELVEKEKQIAEMKDKIAKVEKEKKLLMDEDLQLQRIEDQPKSAYTKLVKVKDGKDATRKSGAVETIKRLRNEKTACRNKQDAYYVCIETLQDQIEATGLLGNAEAITKDSSATVSGSATVGLRRPSIKITDEDKNLMRNKSLRYDEYCKLGHIDDELKVANSELLDENDETKRCRAVANIERLRSARVKCYDKLDLYNEFIDILEDQMASVAHANAIEAFTGVTGATVDENGKFRLPESAASVRRQENLADDLGTSCAPAEQEERINERTDKRENM